MEEKLHPLANLVLWSLGLFMAGGYLFVLGRLILNFIPYIWPCS